MGIVGCYLMPHPPIMVPEVGRDEARKVDKSIEAASEVGREIRDLKPDTLVLISPHGPVFQDAVCIYDFPLKGSLASFGAPEVRLKFEPDEELKKEIIERAGRTGIPVVKSSSVRLSRYGMREELDHGAMVPLYFITQHAKDFKLLPLAFGMLPYEDLYAFGRVIRESADALGKNVVVVASGDLSHRLTPDAPAGFNPQGRAFDEKLVSILEGFDLEALYNLDPALVEKAGECGLRSIWIMLGALDGLSVNSRVLSYEGPFGVGYCVARFRPEGKAESWVEKFYQKRSEKIKMRREKEDIYVKLARQSLETYVKTGRVMEVPEDLPREMLEQRAGVFVSIKKHGQLRGCIGTIMPTRRNIAEEIIKNAISAGCEDPRFFPVEPEELPELIYSVDVLTPPEPIDSPDKLDPKKYGVIVKRGNRTGLLLPDLEGIDTVEEQINIALRKAGIRPDESYELFRFEVIRHH
ncbi:AmmeMemoRadiSam system protein A [Thermosediminibacter oceani]|uniref:AMMECR1 domain protein n=1 Tax=Thermosediminibacter oceani (strain ATCC BAA-1034 / DSM 16646 / JW/IW-1228P) TaxID=555079 RepID=D9S016_THEOJ|nr:AmmeMemoRadiSam system protein A [Thermosediminibacter oceani]ADL08793.1 AMMECR1 domain protein [Thermosediminibacter oceani DSM 16646]